MAISMRTETSTKARSINAITRPNSHRCPRLGHPCDSSPEDDPEDKTGLARGLENQGWRRRCEKNTPLTKGGADLTPTVQCQDLRGVRGHDRSHRAPSKARSCPATSGTWVYEDDQAELLD